MNVTIGKSKKNLFSGLLRQFYRLFTKIIIDGAVDVRVKFRVLKYRKMVSCIYFFAVFTM